AAPGRGGHRRRQHRRVDGLSALGRAVPGGDRGVRAPRGCERQDQGEDPLGQLRAALQPRGRAVVEHGAMNAEEFQALDGLGLAELVRRREVSPAEVLDAAIARVERDNPELNAVVCRLDGQARAAIAAGLPDGPFTGVPYLLKDLGAHYAGAVTSFGSALFKDFAPGHDSEITARLKRGGLVIIGKTNTPELGLASSTEPRLFGPTRNPWNVAYTAGGASRGAPAPGPARRGRRGHGADGACHRRRRLDPYPRVLLRALRAQADACPEPDGTRCRRGLGRRVRGSRGDPDRAGQRGPARRDVRPRRRRPVLGAAAGAAVLAGGRPRSGSPARRPDDEALEQPARRPGVRRGRTGGGAVVRGTGPPRGGGLARDRLAIARRGHAHHHQRQCPGVAR